jgi:hypothetical protein
VSIIASSHTICAGQTVTLTANGASTYSWIPSGASSINEIITPSTTTSFTLNGYSNGCLGSANTQVVVNIPPTISISTTNSLICVGESVILTANTNATSYSWSNGVTTLSASVSPSVSTIYSVSVTDGFCSNSSSITQSVSLCTSLNDISINNYINAFPNPFIDSFNIRWNSSSSANKETQIFVYNVLGELIVSNKTTDNYITVNTKDWNNGAYFIRVNSNVLKVIKQQ